MDEPRDQSPLERFCAVLAAHGVEFIVVGGQAEALMGSARVTYDDAQALALGQNYTFKVDGEYPLDFLGYLEPIGTYEDLLPHTEIVSIGGHATRVIGLDDLIRIKRYLGRPKDKESLLQLEAVKRLREQEGLR